MIVAPTSYSGMKMLTVLDSMSNKAWLPGWIRQRLQESSLRSLLAAEEDKADSLLASAQKRLPLCRTKYSRKRLATSIADVRQWLAELQSSAERESLARHGRKRF